MTALRTKAALVAAAAVLLAGMAAAQSGSANFTKVVAIGDSWGMGYSNASIITSHQQFSFPALFARQVGITGFQQPLVSEPGLGPEYALLALTAQGPVIGPKASTPGQPTNLSLGRPYDNMSVAGATTCDVVNKKQSTSTGDPTDLVLRKLGGSQLQQALSLQPTFVLVMIGGNDVLGAVLSGVAIDGVTLTPLATVQGCFKQILGAIAASGAKMAVGIEPNVLAELPYTNAVKPYVTVNGQKVYLVGQKSDGSLLQLNDQDYLGLPAGSLIAQGFGQSASKPLPNSVVIDRGEAAAIEQRAREIVAMLKSEAQAAGAAIADVGAFLHESYVEPYGVGGIDIGPAFLTGGFYGYDGFHPTNLGYALIANIYIDAVNAKFGSSIGPVDLYPILFGGGAVNAPVTAEEAAMTWFGAEAEDQLRATLNVPSREEIEALLASMQTDGSGEPAPQAEPPGPEQLEEPATAPGDGDLGEEPPQHGKYQGPDPD